jgi:hypothetical protein
MTFSNKAEQFAGSDGSCSKMVEQLLEVTVNIHKPTKTLMYYI